MKKCSLCRKPFDKPLFKCWVLKEGWNNNAHPKYKFIVGFKTLALCFDCKKSPTKFSDKICEKSPHLKEPFHHPICLLSHEEEKRLERKWNEMPSLRERS